MPAEDLAAAVGSFAPDLVALSITQTLNLPSAALAVRAQRDAGVDVPILVGGVLLREHPELWKDLGADGCARSAAEALALGPELVEAAQKRDP